MKNYYEILEISEKASQEVIEKVYKVLVKIYHPDLHDSPEEKAKCEEKIKELNEAYEILSDINKRTEYDKKLAEQRQKETINTILIQTPTSVGLQASQNDLQSNKSNNIYTSSSIQNTSQNNNLYSNSMNKKKGKKDYLRTLIAIFITFGIIILVINLPFVKDYFKYLYNNNSVIHDIANFFSTIFH